MAYRHLEGYDEKFAGKAETDAQGRFRIEGLGAERVVSLSIEGPTIAHTHLDVVTRRIEPIPARGFPNTYGPGTQTIYGADFTLSASPGRVVEGVVRDEKDKKALKDVEVWSYSFAGSNFVGITSLKTRTDGDGRFRLAGFPKGRGNKLLIVPNDDQPYFMHESAVPDPPGLGAVPVEIGLHKGIWIEGKVTDQETKAPVAGAWLHYLPFLENRFAQATPEFRRGGNTDGVGHQQRYQSKADGILSPGRAAGAGDRRGRRLFSGQPYRRGAGAESIKGMNEHGHFATWNNPIMAGRHFPTSMKEINPAEGTETVHLDLPLDPGAKVHLRVVDQQGKPLTGVKTAGRSERGRYDNEAQTQAEFDVVTLGPGEDRMVLLIHEGRKLGRAIHVKEGDDKKGPVVVTLEPSATITGRILDADGDPVPGATIRSDPKPGGDFSLSLPQVTSGNDGRFTVRDVPTGCEYSLVAESGAMISQRRVAFGDAAVRPASHGRRRDPIQERLTPSGSSPGEPIPMGPSRWSPYRPRASAPWDLARAWTLRRRAGFAATWDELQRDLESGPDTAVDRILDGTGRIQGMIAEFATTADLLGDAATAASDAHRLQAWWLYRMLFTPDPLTERLTLVWHNHFATSQLKVDDVEAMRRQNETFRRHARGPFGDLLRAMLRDPALLVWLDAPSNRKGKPNENLARELMELFTLGVGQFSERDVKEVARALTGRTVVHGRYAVRPDWHDDAPKTFLGKDGRFDGDKVADILLQHPATARRLAWRLCQSFLGESVADEPAVSELAERLRARRPARGAGGRDDPPLGALLLHAEPARAGLGAGWLRHRHGAQPRALRPASRARSCSPSGPAARARSSSSRPMWEAGPAVEAGCRVARSSPAPTSPRLWSVAT